MARDPLRAARWGLALRFALLFTLLLGASSGALFWYMRHALLASLDDAFSVAAHDIVETLEPRGGELSVRHHDFDEEFLEQSAALGVVSLSLWQRGRLVAHAPLDQAPPAAEGPRQEVRGERERMIVVRRLPLDQPGAALVISRRAGEVGRLLASLRDGLLLLLPAGLLGSLALGHAMARQALWPVQRAMDQQIAFMADASHEMRTPLAVILAQAEAQLDAAGDAAGVAAALSSISRAARQLTRLVDDLLLLSRADASELNPRRLAFSLDELAEEVVASLLTLARARGCQLTLLAPERSVQILADPDQIQRLLGILIENAIKHGGAGPIEVRVDLVGSWARVLVDDSGPGIAPDLLPHLFERFVRGPGSASVPGHGLGLAIARSITRAHKGELSLATRDQGGTRATVLLPWP